MQRRVFILPTRAGLVARADARRAAARLDQLFAVARLRADVPRRGRRVGRHARDVPQPRPSASASAARRSGVRRRRRRLSRRRPQRVARSIVMRSNYRSTASGARCPCDPAASGEADVAIPVPTTRRGRQPMPRVTLATRFPLGLWRAWSYWTPALNALVYPRPAAGDVPLPLAHGDGREHLAQRVRGSEDFAGLRGYVPGDPVRHIAWRAMARNPEGRVLTKLFDGGASGEAWLTLDAAIAHDRRIRVGAVVDDALGARRRGATRCATASSCRRRAIAAGARPGASRRVPRGARARMSSVPFAARRPPPAPRADVRRASSPSSAGASARSATRCGCCATLAWVLLPHAIELPAWCERRRSRADRAGARG